MEVGVRDLRNRLSTYLAAVKEGQTVTITEHGRPIARLSAAGERSVLERLISDRLATVPTRRKERSEEPVVTGAMVSDLVADQRR